MSAPSGGLRRDRPPPPSPSGPRGGEARPRAAVVASAVAMALVAGHIVLTAVYNTPSEGLRDRTSLGAASAAYIEPYLTQGYRMYAPEPLDADRALLVRATVVPPRGEPVVTSWVDATAVELASPARRLLRPQPSLRVAGSLIATFSALSHDQRLAAAADYGDADDLAPLQSELLAADRDREDEALAFVRASNVAASYGTQVATALWGEDGEVVAVETRAVATPVSSRDGEAAPEPSATETGRLPAIEWAAQDDQAFSASFRAWAERAGVDADAREEEPIAPDDGGAG